VGESVAFVAVGANIRPEHNIRAALTLLREKACVLASSTFYRTRPLGRVNQPLFVNGVWLIRTDRTPLHVRDRLLQPVETKLGRRRTDDKFGPRTIDLDLILYDALTVSDGELTLPHPDLGRPFVCLPVLELLADCAADIESPVLQRIRKLVPQPTTAAKPGEELRVLTRQLRELLSA
jgi:2-amino-4-hydroxy-6-hydroxymethyldihydropteridine diphosphokinase